MSTDDVLYDGHSNQEWMEQLDKMDDWNTRHLLSLFALFGIPKSFLDVGCGTGIMTLTAQGMGIKAYGVDQLVDDKWPKNFYHYNLVNLFKLPESVEMVVSFEVAEHLHESSHATFCDTLCENLKRGNHFLIFSEIGRAHV